MRGDIASVEADRVVLAAVDAAAQGTGRRGSKGQGETTEVAPGRIQPPAKMFFGDVLFPGQPLNINLPLTINRVEIDDAIAEPTETVIVTNPGDDIRFMDLEVWPDFDSVLFAAPVAYACWVSGLIGPG